ncbi:MAG: rhodanese-like domain-containing protein [Bacilli bacterium]|nr:rhodanese-like domain-containing protein [Bacilli bacterium]
MDIDFENINGRKLIDIRDSYKYLEKHIPGSINIEENKILLMPEYYINRNEEYVIYCDNGYRSMKVSNFLNTQGYKVYNLTGGINLYLKNNS